jgi:hypothetical protein
VVENELTEALEMLVLAMRSSKYTRARTANQSLLVWHGIDTYRFDTEYQDSSSCGTSHSSADIDAHN